MTSGGTRGAVVRKVVHVLVSLLAAAVTFTLAPVTAAAVLAAATLIALTVELARRMSPSVADTFQRRFGDMLKDGEARGVSGATTLAVGFTLAAVLLPGTPALAGILFAGLADPAAAMVGQTYGRRRYPGGKSPAGSAAVLVVVFGIATGLGLGPGRAALAALLVMIAEAPTFRIDDNLYLPSVGAVAVKLAGWLTGA